MHTSQQTSPNNNKNADDNNKSYLVVQQKAQKQLSRGVVCALDSFKLFAVQATPHLFSDSFTIPPSIHPLYVCVVAKQQKQGPFLNSKRHFQPILESRE